jgi:predicted amidohydrolase
MLCQSLQTSQSFRQGGLLRIALAQTVGTPGDVAANLRRLAQLAGEAAAGGAGLLVLPELYLTGYNIGDRVAALAEPANGPSARVIADCARRHGIAIAYGYPERAAGGVYNTAALIDRQGELGAAYRKIHLWGDFEKAQFRPGDGCEPFTLDGLRLGLMICFDVEFPELALSLALAGCEAVIAISATGAPYTVVPRHVVPARAYENAMFVAFCNHAGGENGLAYAGESCVAAPDGSLLAAAGAEETLILADLAPEPYAAYRADHRYLDERRPALYHLA